MDESLAAFSFHQRPQAFTHTPPDVAQDLQAVRTRYKKGDAAIAQDSYGFGKAVECLQLKAGKIKPLELFFRKHGEQHSAISTQPNLFAAKDAKKKAEIQTLFLLCALCVHCGQLLLAEC